MAQHLLARKSKNIKAMDKKSNTFFPTRRSEIENLNFLAIAIDKCKATNISTILFHFEWEACYLLPLFIFRQLLYIFFYLNQIHTTTTQTCVNLLIRVLRKIAENCVKRRRKIVQCTVLKPANLSCLLRIPNNFQKDMKK